MSTAVTPRDTARVSRGGCSCSLGSRQLSSSKEERNLTCWLLTAGGGLISSGADGR